MVKKGARRLDGSYYCCDRCFNGDRQHPELSLDEWGLIDLEK